MSKKTVRSRLRQGRLPVRVYKLGGPTLEDPALLPLLAEELRRADANVVLVHGGGRRVDAVLNRLGIETRFVEGRRETSPAAMEIVEMVLAGSVNKGLAAELTRAGLPALGLSGRDAALLRAEPVPGLGRVGTRLRVNPDPILALWSGGFVPVVAPISAGPDGGALNVNADEAALGIAMALFARALVYLSDAEGVRVGEAPQSALSAEVAMRLIEDGIVAGGMAIKVRTALAAAAAGVPEVVIAGRARLTGGFPGTRVSAASPGVEARG